VGTDLELNERRDCRQAAEALLAAMDDGHFDLDLEAVDRLNWPQRAPTAPTAYR
jgi:hypothetical protein